MSAGIFGVLSGRFFRELLGVISRGAKLETIPIPAILGEILGKSLCVIVRRISGGNSKGILRVNFKLLPWEISARNS